MSMSKRKKSKLKSYTTPIIGGEFKGKMIEIPAISTTRSSKSILRESLFNTLQFNLIDKVFVEVFAGSGSVGLEAVSRGASKAWCIEKNREVYNILCSNVQKVAPTKVETIWGDSFNEFKTVYKEIKALNQKAYFYFDPPFNIREGMEDIYNKTLKLLESIEASHCEMAIIEHITNIDMPKEIGELTLNRKRRFGKSTLSYYKAVQSDES